MNLRTIDITKLEAEIDKRDAAMKAVARGRSKVNTEEGILYGRLMAEHNALVSIYNCIV